MISCLTESRFPIKRNSDFHTPDRRWISPSIIHRMMRQAQEVGEQAYQNRKRMKEVMERTAHNTDVTNERLEKMID